MNLLIVEDEIRLRTSLANNIAWEENEIELIGVASRGYEALDIFALKKPDLVLLDIRIPEIDGITLARKFIAIHRLVKLVILSGHDNFTYAQSALEIGVMKYLLKPAGNVEILQAMLEAKKQLEAELEQLHNQLELQQKWQEQLVNLQQSFLQNWTTGKYSSWEIDKYSRELQVALAKEDQYVVVVLDMDPILEEEKRFAHKDSSLLQFMLHSMVKESLQSSDQCRVFTAAEGYTVIIFAEAEGNDANYMLLHINVLVTNLLAKVYQYLKLTASAGICGSTYSYDKVHVSYTEAIRALQDRVLYGHNIAIPYQEQLNQDLDLFTFPQVEKQLVMAIEVGNLRQADKCLLELWNNSMLLTDSVDDVHEYVLYFSSLLVRIIQQQGWRLKDVLGDGFQYVYNAQQFISKEQIMTWLQRTVTQIITYAQQQQKTVSNKMVKNMIAIVNNELHAELTLHTIADRLFVNSSYLSRLFKQEMGVTFSMYVLDQKMTQAKELLQQGMKVYDAASRVGYRDVSYFTKAFRKYWGVTPGEVKV
ncbi:helix-turn-helix domain-containing protein [Paenibacillus yanchengensis]|uniref:Helix-turn-helix domain-containing protein n=1 Tax=Paenibacillus yanchengensis TaxID=2035833 RepID=A0ABW4YES7_9BACL